MESINSKIDNENKKLIFDINNTNNNIEYKYCPHIKNHFLNSFINSSFEKINLSPPENTLKEKEKTQNKFLYINNLSLLQNNFKSFNYLGYKQTSNLFNSFLCNNFSLDYYLLNNPQNLSINGMIREGCIFCLNFNDTGNLMGSSTQDNMMEIWDISSKKLKKAFQPHSELVADIEFFHNELDNQCILTCSLDKTIKLWKNYKSVHTFMEHSDWVKCLNIRQDNIQFLSGCVSSVVKLWDIPTQRIIASIKNCNKDPKVLPTVNSLHFLNNNQSMFIVGLRSGEIKLYDMREKTTKYEFTKNVGLVHCFKAHNKKLNNAVLNSTDKYLITSSRDSIIRLWDFRKLPNINDTEESIKKNKKYIYEYNKHKCVGYNIGCSFYNNEQYIITGSEDYCFYIYDIFNPNNYQKNKTQQKCINFLKPIPNSYDICFSGIEDISIYVWNARKNITKYYQQKNFGNGNDVEEENDGDKFLEEIEETDNSKLLCNKLIEDIMTECGDSILRIFHKQNLTYSGGISFETLINIVRESNDIESKNILRTINEKLKEKIIESFISGAKKKVKEDKKTENNKKNMITKKEIKCLECQNKDKNIINNDIKDDENNIFNSVNREQLYELLILPNKYGFNENKENKENNENKNIKEFNSINIAPNIINGI